jgi:hypothetical protein
MVQPMDRRVFLKLSAALTAGVAFPLASQAQSAPAVSGASTEPEEPRYNLEHLNDPAFRLIDISWIPADKVVHPSYICKVVR